MHLDWIDVKPPSFNTLLLLERFQVGLLPGWAPDRETAEALHANTVVEWFLRHRCPEPHVIAWLDRILAEHPAAPGPEQARDAEIEVMRTINDLILYAVDPSIYDNMGFLGWDSRELTGLVDFAGKIVLDVGSGTGRLAFTAAEAGAHAVFAVEPVGNLRAYIKDKAARKGLDNVFPADGIITDLPFPAGFAAVTMSGHVFGDHPAEEIRELERVTAPGGLVVLCPGNNDKDNDEHRALVNAGYEWSRFEEPVNDWKRKYWRVMP